MNLARNDTRIVGIDLFCGAGGMTLGAHHAGIKVIYAVEKCPHAAATYRLNFPMIPLHADDIRKVHELPPKPRGARTVIFGGPPCQGFSTSNQRTRNGQNPNNWLFMEFIRLVSLWKPDWVVMENVKGITETEGGRFLTGAIQSLEAAGYSVSFKLLNSVDFGVPQRRTRAFIVGSRRGKAYGFPTPGTRKALTVLEAIGDLPSLSNGASIDELPYGRKASSPYARKLRNGRRNASGNLVTRNARYIIERYLHVPPGGNWTHIPESLFSNYTDYERCHTGIYRRLDATKPSVVIGNFRKNMLIHPYENRGLSIREAARIQSVPDHFCFSGSIGFQQQQVGNMVPPRLAEAVFQQLPSENVCI